MVAMSGGVDSSVAALLLHQKGYEVIGIGLQFPKLSSNTEWQRSCCRIEDLEDARRVAAKIGIPFYILNYEKIFEENVINYFYQSWLNGKTPNPCIECNRKVKFGHLLKLADLLEANFIATGHYANIFYDQYHSRFLLKKGVNPETDQSYFLYFLSQEQLSRILFPLGNLTKEKTRKIAKDSGLKIHDKPSSQEICFLGQTDHRSFLSKKFPGAFQPGPVVNTKGEILGWHQGIIGYTVGQRKGLGISARKRLYICGIDVVDNRIIVGTKEESVKIKASITGVNWIAFAQNPRTLSLKVKIRYRQPEIPAHIWCKNNAHGEIWFSEPQQGVTPGQAAVFYDGDIVVGGGTIE